MPSYSQRELEPTVVAASALLSSAAPSHCIIGGVAVMFHAQRAYTADMNPELDVDAVNRWLEPFDQTWSPDVT